MDNATDPQFMTTREVAALLRVKERKVYDLAAADEIPHRRLTGKLLFPRAEIEAWAAGAPTDAVTRPPVIAGSHDPLLDWAVRAAGSGLAVLFDGSSDGLARFRRGEAALAGLHIPEDGPDWNRATLAASGLRDAVLIGWARRRQGLILPPGRSLPGLAGLAGRRVALRQPGAGARALFERLAAAAGLDTGRLAAAPIARTESEAAEAVAAGTADAAFGLEAAAKRHALGFLPLADEQFDLLIDRRAHFTPPVQRLLRFTRDPAFAARASEFGGYDLAPLGEVRWLSP